jgi:hypothetical protein
MKNKDGKSSLTLTMQDVYQDGLQDRVDITLKHTVLSDTRTIKNQNASKRLRIPDLEFTQGGIYNLTIFPTRYRPVGGFVKINEGQNTNETYMFPVDPTKITKVEFPAYADLAADLRKLLKNSNAVENKVGKVGADLYNAFDDTQRAGLLNIYWKMQHTTFADTRNVFAFIDSLTRVRGDRFFANIQKELRDETVNSQGYHLFHDVSGESHNPPQGYELTDSYKTFDHYGNLQLTFFSKPQTLQFIVDADIDDAQGIEHWFQVIRNIFTGATNPYDIHEILIGYQSIDPGYKLVV